METKRNDIKEFAIGTKIEYNGKLYEVVQGKYCNDCSIASICSSNDITSGNNITGILSRDKRISIFGECSSIVRSDGKSVVFKEIPKIKEQDVYNVGPLYKTNNELMPIQINLPNDYVIDKEYSDLDKGIIKFKNKWLSLEQLYRLVRENHYLTNRSAIKDFSNSKLVALATLIDIARYFNGDWKYNATKGNIGYMIVIDIFIKETNYSVCQIDTYANIYCGNIIFKNKADAQYVIDNPNFRHILDTIFKYKNYGE